MATRTVPPTTTTMIVVDEYELTSDRISRTSRQVERPPPP